MTQTNLPAMSAYTNPSESHVAPISVPKNAVTRTVTTSKDIAEITEQLINDERSRTDFTSNSTVLESTNQTDSDILLSLQTDNVPTSGATNEARTTSTTSSDEAVLIDDTTELIFIIDSNARYIDFRRLWTLKTTEIVRCGNMQDVYQYWSRNKKKYSKLKYFFMSVGTNDLVHRTPHQLFTNIRDLAAKLQETFQGIKIILSEVTPRMDQVDKRVEEVNRLLHQFVQDKADFYIIRNSNLRNPGFYTDDVHLNHSITPRFASNIKRALRAAHGIKEPEKDQYKHTRNSYDRPRTLDQGYGDRSTFERMRNELIVQILRAFQYTGT